LSVTDNAGDAVFLHVFASNERQECRNKTGLKKRRKHEILKQHDVCVSIRIVVLFHRLSGHTFTFTSYFCATNTLKETQKTFLKLFSTLVTQICICRENETLSFSMSIL